MAVAGGKATVSGVAGRYATALFELAEEQKIFDVIARDVARLSEALAVGDELSGVLDNPSISRASLAGVADALAQRLDVHDVVRKFLGLMAANRRLSALPATLDAFSALAAEKRNEMVVEVTAAALLSQQQEASLSSALAAAAGKKIHMKIDVDPDLIGGLIVKMGSKMIDASVRSKLTTLQHAMREAGR